MKSVTIILSILLAGSLSWASTATNSCSSQGILPGGCTDMPKTTASADVNKTVVFEVPKIHCGGCQKNIDKVISKLNLPKAVTHKVSVEDKNVALMFAETVTDKQAKAYSETVRKALNKRGYKVTN